MSRLEDAIADLFDPRLSAAETMDRRFSPDFRQRVNGVWVDRAGFLARIAQFRADAAGVTLTVLDEQAQDDRYAERHVIDLRLRTGGWVLQEVYLFAQRDAQGRFRCIEEVTLPLAPPVSDGGGSA